MIHDPLDGSQLPSYRPIRARVLAKLSLLERPEEGTLLMVFLASLAAHVDLVSLLVKHFPYEEESRTLYAFAKIRRYLSAEIQAIEDTTTALRTSERARGVDPVLVERGIDAKLCLELFGESTTLAVWREIVAYYSTRQDDGAGGAA